MDFHERSYDMGIKDSMSQKLGKGIAEASNEELYSALLEIVQELSLIHI